MNQTCATHRSHPTYSESSSDDVVDVDKAMLSCAVDDSAVIAVDMGVKGVRGGWRKQELGSKTRPFFTLA